MNGVPLVGASAGDVLNFHQTHLIHECHIHHAAILLLIETDTQFRTFRTQAFEPTKTQLVVTAADPERRVVYEFNAEPAAFEYANAIGLSDKLESVQLCLPPFGRENSRRLLLPLHSVDCNSAQVLLRHRRGPCAYSRPDRMIS